MTTSCVGDALLALTSVSISWATLSKRRSSCGRCLTFIPAIPHAGQPQYADRIMTVGKGKRPRDPNQLAKWIVDRSTDETPEAEHASEPATSSSSTIPPQVSEYMAAIGRKGGQIGGKRRLKTMTKEQRRKVAARPLGLGRKPGNPSPIVQRVPRLH